MNILKMNPRFRDVIHDGTLRCTMRRGHRTEYVTGDIILIASLDQRWSCNVQLIDVIHCNLASISVTQLQRAGFATQDEALIALQSYYPDLNFESPMTVLAWLTPFNFWEEPSR